MFREIVIVSRLHRGDRLELHLPPRRCSSKDVHLHKTDSIVERTVWRLTDESLSPLLPWPLKHIASKGFDLCKLYLVHPVVPRHIKHYYFYVHGVRTVVAYANTVKSLSSTGIEKTGHGKDQLRRPAPSEPINCSSLYNLHRTIGLGRSQLGYGTELAKKAK